MAKEVKPYVVGMDIGGTNTVFGIVDQAGNVVCQDSIKTKAYPVIDDYVNAIGEARRSHRIGRWQGQDPGYGCRCS